MTEDFIVPVGACTDQWWPIEDDDYSDICPDQWWPDISEETVLEAIKRLTEQSGLYMVWMGKQYGKSTWMPKAYTGSDHNPDPVIVSYGGQQFEARGFSLSGQILDEVEIMTRETYAWNFDDPTVETPQTRADILAWKRKRNTGPPKNPFRHRGNKQS